MNSGTSENGTIQFSVVIPVYNAEKTIERALDSVFAQSYPAYEIIVVDDGSNDDTVTILQNKYEGRVRLIQKIGNTGVSIARNTGMAAATGTHIAFLDADDAWHRDKLAVMHTILSAQPQIKLLYHPYTQEPILDKRIPENLTVYKFPFIKLLLSNPIAPSCAVIPNVTAYRFDGIMRYAEDLDLWLRIGYSHKIYCITIPLTQIYRAFTSQGGASGKKWKMRRGEIRAFRKLISLNPLFIFLFPFLLISSIGKYFYKMVFRN